MEPESDGDTKCNWCTWHCHQRIGTGTRGLANKKTSGDHPNYCPISWGCRICWLHLCRGVKPSPPPPQRGYLLAVGGNPWYLRIGSWWLSSTWPENRVVKFLATHHFGPYWARQVVREAQSDQLAGHDSPLLVFFCFFFSKKFKWGRWL